MKRIGLSGLSRVLTVASLVLLSGCAQVRQIRIENVSTRNFTNVSIAGQAYGDIAPEEMTDYRSVKLKFRYAAMKLHVDGKYVTAQSLNFGAKRFTYRIDVKSFDKGHLEIDVIRDKPEATATRPASNN